VIRLVPVALSILINVAGRGGCIPAILDSKPCIESVVLAVHCIVFGNSTSLNPSPHPLLELERWKTCGALVCWYRRTGKLSPLSVFFGRRHWEPWSEIYLSHALGRGSVSTTVKVGIRLLARLGNFLISDIVVVPGLLPIRVARC
jgi:hypothetical protein